MFSSSLPFEVVAQIQIRPSIIRLHCFASEALNMLAIFISVLSACGLHARPREFHRSVPISEWPPRAPPGPSRALSSSSVALAPSLQALQPSPWAEASSSHITPHILGVKSVSLYTPLSPSPLACGSSFAARVVSGWSVASPPDLQALVSSQLSEASHLPFALGLGATAFAPMPSPFWPLVLPALLLPPASLVPLSAGLSSGVQFRVMGSATSLASWASHMTTTYGYYDALALEFQVMVTATSSASYIPSTTSTDDHYDLYSRQLVGIVSVKRASSVPPPVLSSAGGGAKASTTCSTFGPLATCSFVGVPSHLPEGHPCGLSSASVSLTSTLLSSSTTCSTLCPLATCSFVGVPSHFPEGHLCGLSPASASLTSTLLFLFGGSTCSSMGDTYRLPPHANGLSPTSSAVSTTAGMVATISCALWSTGCSESSRSGCVEVAGSLGFMASFLAYFSETVDSTSPYFLDAHRTNVAFHIGQGPPAHWLAHLDYDLVFRRRPAFACNLFGSEGRWNFIIAFSVSRCAARMGSTLTALLYATQAYTSAVHACENNFDSLIPVFFAVASNVALARATLGWNPLTGWAPFISDLGRGLIHAHKPTRLLFWVLIFARVQEGLSVCLSCSGNDPNCPGDNTCALAKALVANVAVMAGTAGAAQALSMGENGKHILPLPWLQFLKPSILQTLVRLAQQKPAGTPVDLPSLLIKELTAAISGGSVSVQDGRLEFLRRMSEDGVTSEDLQRMKTICEVLPQRADDARFISPLSKLSSSGALQFVYALATQIVRSLSSTSKVSLSMGDSSNNASSSQVSVELKRPLSIEAFVYSLTVWQTLLSATGLANMVVTGPFVCEVVHDVILSRGWKVALEHFLIYLQKIDSGVGWQLATATSLGSHDTFMHKALCAAGEFGKGPPQVPISPKSVESKEAVKGGEGNIIWNGKFNDDPSARPCAAFNLGQDHKNLKSDGSCPFNHICDQWVSDKGKGGQCKLKHSRASCTNSAKAASKSE